MYPQIRSQPLDSYTKSDAVVKITWVTIFSSNLPAAAPFQFKYAEVTNSPVRFYRLSQTPGS